MKQRFSSHATLIELAAALMIFMLASVTILKLFTTAYDLSCESSRLTKAVLQAQSCAEILAAEQDAAGALARMGYEQTDSDVLRYAAEDDMVIQVQLENEQTEVGEMMRAQIAVLYQEEALVHLPVSRYINKEVIHP